MIMRVESQTFKAREGKLNKYWEHSHTYTHTDIETYIQTTQIHSDRQQTYMYRKEIKPIQRMISTSHQDLDVVHDKIFTVIIPMLVVMKMMKTVRYRHTHTNLVPP